MDSLYHFSVTDASGVGEIRRAATRESTRLAFGEVKAGNLAIAASEMASNLFKHAGGGEFYLISNLEESRIELIASDSGPGMANVGLCMQDGYSTSSTVGGGLGALRRLADEFGIYSLPDKGTLISCTFLLKPSETTPLETPASMNWSLLNLPFPGEIISGDAGAYFGFDNKSLAILADGLGHGPEAHEASARAVLVASQNLHSPPSVIMEKVHTALFKTRGAAVAIALIDHATDLVTYAGIGNISAQIVSDTKAQSLVSKDGIVGQNSRRFDAITYPWSRESLLIMHSDGLNSRTRLDDLGFPGIRGRSPKIISAFLMREFRRGRDDAAVLVGVPKQSKTW